MDGAGSQVRPCTRTLRASASRCDAYDAPPMPDSITMSSQAYSLSQRRRAHAIQNSGLNHWLARTISASNWIGQVNEVRHMNQYTVKGDHRWLIGDPGRFVEVLTNVLAVVDGLDGPDDGRVA